MESQLNDASSKVSITRSRRRLQIRKTSGTGEADVAIAAAETSEVLPVGRTNAAETDGAVRIKASGGNPEATRLKPAQVALSPVLRLSGMEIVRRDGKMARNGETAKAAGTTTTAAILRAAIAKHGTLSRELRGR